MARAARRASGTSGENLLQHIDKEVHPSKTYKISVLHSLIERLAIPKRWNIEEIEKDFKDFYLQNKRYMQNYTFVTRETNPAEYLVSRVRTHILRMPFNFLSNSEDDFFIIDRDASLFQNR